MILGVRDGRNAAVLGMFQPKPPVMIITVINCSMIEFAPIRLPVDEKALPRFVIPKGNDDNDDDDLLRIVKARCCFFLGREGRLCVMMVTAFRKQTTGKNLQMLRTLLISNNVSSVS